MQKRHSDPEHYFNEQALSCAKFYIPYIAAHVPQKGTVLEIGCGWGGGLSAFAAQGYTVSGVDIESAAIEFATNIFAQKGLAGDFTCADIFDFSPTQKFDLVIMHDAIEHIHNKELLMLKIKELLAPEGVLYVAFPPWQMPFGGHHQMAQNRLLANFPYIHLLPRPLFKWIFKLFGESESEILYFFDLRETGITIGQFEKLVRKTGYNVLNRQFWFINPNYETKFGLKPRKQSRFMSRVPWLRNFITTTCYYLLTVSDLHNANAQK